MKSIFMLLKRFPCILMLMVLSTESIKAQSNDNDVKQELFKLETSLNTWVKTHDTASLNGILANEYLLTGPRFPGSTPKNQWLVNCMKISFDSASISEITVTNYGEVAVFHSLQLFYNPMMNGQPRQSDSWLTDLWIKRKGRWQLITRLSERLPKK